MKKLEWIDECGDGVIFHAHPEGVECKWGGPMHVAQLLLLEDRTAIDLNIPWSMDADQAKAAAERALRAIAEVGDGE